MLKKMFTVYDSASKTYMTPFFMNTTGEAIRAFEDTTRDENSLIAKHPADYTLFEIGTYEDTAALFTHQDAPINLGCAVEYAPTK